MGEEAGAGEPAPISCPMPRRRWVDRGLVVAFGAAFVTNAPVLEPGLFPAAHRLVAGLGVPDAVATTLLLGAAAAPWLAIVVILAVDMTRFRAVHLDADGVIVGVLDPPRGLRLGWHELTGFVVTSQGVVLHERRRTWLRPGRTLMACEGEVVHRIVTRLEAHGVPRLDG